MQAERARRPARPVRGGEHSGRLHAVALLPTDDESDAEEESHPDPGADTDRPVVPRGVGAAGDRNVGLELLVEGPNLLALRCYRSPAGFGQPRPTRCRSLATRSA